MIAKPVWRCRSIELDLSTPKIMGIVNVTPDSFSDGGRYNDLEAALTHARRLLEQGADIVDVGGESTRPGAASVSAQEELDRVVAVVEKLASEGAVVSVDTSKPMVMAEAARAGAQILNDVRAFSEAGAIEVASESGCGLCVMHMRGNPQTMQLSTEYAEFLSEVSDYLRKRASVLMQAGCPKESIVIDPGFGFGKSVEQNFELIARAPTLTQLGFPLLYGMSRKSSIGEVTGLSDPIDRDAASAAAHLLAVERGVAVVRVHDVKMMRSVLDVYAAVKSQTKGAL